MTNDGEKATTGVLEHKHSGYGYYDQVNQHVLMMGGFVSTSNENKASKIINLID